MDLKYKNNEINHLVNNILDEKFENVFGTLNDESMKLVHSYIFDDTTSYQTLLNEISNNAIKDIQKIQIKDPYIKTKLDLAIDNVKDNDDKIAIIEIRNDLQT